MFLCKTYCFNRIRLKCCFQVCTNVLKRSYSSTGRKPSRTTHYDVLGVKPNATSKEIRDAFVRLSKQLHPDMNPTDPSNHDKFVKLNEAYSILSKPLTRREYDVSIVARYYQYQNLTANAFGSHKPGSSPTPGSSPNFESEAHQAEFWDETIFHMRNKAKDANAFYNEDTYYGIKGVRKLPNVYILAGCFIIIGLGTLYFFAGLRWSKSRSDKYLEQDKKLSSHLDEVRKRAKKSRKVRRRAKRKEKRKQRWKYVRYTNLEYLHFLQTHKSNSLAGQGTVENDSGIVLTTSPTLKKTHSKLLNSSSDTGKQAENNSTEADKQTTEESSKTKSQALQERDEKHKALNKIDRSSME